jgi:hypothetical protein
VKIWQTNSQEEMIMKFANLKKVSEAQFRRITGVKKKTFDTMIRIVKEAEVIKKAKGGRPHKMSMENRILMTLEYLREYRTYAHIGASYGVSESSAFQAIRYIENLLVKSKEFKLPGKKALVKSDHEIEIVLIDATESPIERPKKNSVNTIQAKRSVIR